MRAAPSLHELQQQFMAALYDPAKAGPAATVVGNGLTPAARLSIYRRSCNETQTAALRTTYPAVVALVGETSFDQSARNYRRAHPSRSGNLQVFGDALADYLATVPGCRPLPYLPDVARLEWLRQQAILAPSAAPLSPENVADAWHGEAESIRIVLHPSVHCLDSRYPVLTIWNYALRPADTNLVLGNDGENVVMWREEDEVAMDAVDPASFACITALAHELTLDEACTAAVSIDSGFDFAACLESLVAHGLVTGIRPYAAPRTEPPTWR
ncbi:MAG TPA: DNA-binding domain-containing protein [Nevskiaceae bacterium]|nr:DNA-binding domain-containing protein [Nevskiaceae bacterium]